MFAPPPPSSLTSEELAARRAQARLAIQVALKSKSNTEQPTVTGDGSSDGSAQSKGSPGLYRKIGLKGLSKDKAGRPDISAPILDDKPTNKPLPLRPTESPGERASNARSGPPSPSPRVQAAPKRPPRPAKGLTMRTLPTLASYRRPSIKANDKSALQDFDVVDQPLKRYIHLRNGSVVTVTPPLELDLWTYRVYLPGPIKVQKPDLLSRRGSVASLEPFQDMLSTFQLGIGRRRSEDSTANDICGFFEDFGTCDIFPERLSSAWEDILEETDDEDDAGFHSSQDRFLTPPDPPVIGPAQNKPFDILLTQELPPLETEETLRARGIASVRRSKDLPGQKKAALEASHGEHVELPDTPPASDSRGELTSLRSDASLNAEANAATTELSTSRGRIMLEDEKSTRLEESSAPWIRSNRQHKAASVLKRFSQ